MVHKLNDLENSPSNTSNKQINHDLKKLLHWLMLTKFLSMLASDTELTIFKLN